MAGIYYLSADDFVIANGNTGPILCHKIPGMSMILFYSKKCNKCVDLLPLFKGLPQKVNGCIFGIANVSVEGKRLLNMSQETVSKIEYLPYIVMYNDGKPFMEYRGDRTLENIIQFVHEVNQYLNKQQQFTKGQVCQGGAPGVQAWCPVGKPLTDDVCYISFKDAYDPNGKKEVMSDSVCLNYDKAYGRCLDPQPGGQQQRPPQQVYQHPQGSQSNPQQGFLGQSHMNRQQQQNPQYR
jgi:thiol-disulfide isomerase/thioredoxin